VVTVQLDRGKSPLSPFANGGEGLALSPLSKGGDGGNLNSIEKTSKKQRGLFCNSICKGVLCSKSAMEIAPCQ
jgi:hypothetical protein